MNKKLMQVGKYWGASHEAFQGYGSIDVAELRPFDGDHPKVMEHWLRTEAERVFQPDPSYKLSRRDYRNRIRFWLEDKFDLEFSKKHYTAIK